MATRAEARRRAFGEEDAGVPDASGGDLPRFTGNEPSEGLSPSAHGAAPTSTHPSPGPSTPPHSAVRGPMPFGPAAATGEGTNPQPAAAREERGSVADVDVLLDSFDDETRPRYFNWQQRIVDFFRDISSLNLPDESLLVGSLPGTPSAVLMQEDAMWNLALCVAFGSDRLADAAAEAFFHAQVEQPAIAGIDWITRTLLSRGFMPSGIPSEAGERAVSVLRRHCPIELRAELERTLWD